MDAYKPSPGVCVSIRTAPGWKWPLAWFGVQKSQKVLSSVPVTGLVFYIPHPHTHTALGTLQQ